MKEILLALFIFTGFQLKADELKSPYKVIILDNTVDGSKLGAHKVQNYKQSNLPDIKKRDLDFKVAGIRLDSKMDDLDKDVLWVTARRVSLEDLQKKYPNISKEQLKALSVQVKK